MTGQALPMGNTRTRARIGSPPVPHEHGAWVMLYAPLLVGMATAGRFAWAPAILLTLAVTGIFMAREAAGLLLRRRGKPGTAFWFGVYAAAAAAGAVPLLAAYGRTDLLVVGGLAAALFVIHSTLLLIPARKRLDRSQWGEILGVGALALTAPAAWAAAGQPLAMRAWLVWAACTLYFSSGVFVVKMVLAAVKVKGDFLEHDRWDAGRDNVFYHGLLALLVAAGAVWVGGWHGALLAAAYVPVLTRALTRWRALTNRLPNLKRLGWAESAYAVWFAALLAVAIRW